MGTICLQCGDEGWENAFVDCVRCLKFSVHRYCLDKIPETADEFVDWVCDNCEGPSGRGHHVTQVQKRDTSKPKDIESTFGVEEKGKGVVTVRAVQIPRNIPEQRRDSCKKHESVDSVESNEGCPGSHLIEANKKNCTPLAREERKSEKTCETLGKEKSSEDILLKDIAKNKKKKCRFENPGNEKDQRSVIGDTSAKQSHKKRKDVDTRELVVLSPTVKQSSDLGDKRRVSVKSHESDKDPSTRKDRVSLCNGSADGLKKHKTGSSNKISLQEEKFEKYTPRLIQDIVDCDLDNQRNEVCNEAIRSDIYNDSDGKIIPAQVQEGVFATNPTVNYGEDFLEDSENQTPQPIAIPIWSGGFHISNKDRILDGLVAHLSDRACEKVYATACEFRPIIDFEMHPKSQVWPKSFEKVEPSGESIALYFFASKMSANVFDRLVNDMRRKELALKAVLGDAELLIFTSTELPMHYWRFQHKFYLWGVFRGKQRVPSNGCAIAKKSPDMLKDNGRKSSNMSKRPT